VRTTIASIIRGTASKIGGGKFSNGAVSGAFVHMFNAENSFKKTFTAFKSGLSSIGDYAARIFGVRDLQVDSVGLGNYYQEQAILETKETFALLGNVAKHPQLALDAYAKYNNYNSEQLNLDFTAKGLATIFATGIPFIISSVGNIGSQAGELNRYINHHK